MSVNAGRRQLVAQHGSVSAAFAQQSMRESTSFAQFAERWMREYVAVHNKPSEQYTKQLVMRVHLLPMFGSLDLRAVSVAEIDRFKSKLLRDGLKPKSINNYLTILRKCLGTAMDWDLISALPRIRLLKSPAPGFRYLTEEEVLTLVDASEGVWRDMILFAARTGLRFSELTALDWGDIDFANRIVSVRSGRVLGQIGSPKNYRSRHVPLTTAVIASLESSHRREGLLFQYQNNPISPQTANRHLHAMCTRAGIAPHGWHVLRHTFASLLAQRGASLQALKELLGHSSMTMVLRYAHLAPNYLAETVRLLESAPANMASGCQPALIPPMQPAGLEAFETHNARLSQDKKDHAFT